MNRIVFLLLIITLAAAPGWADPDPDPKSDGGAEVLTRYQEAVARQQDSLKNVAMDVTMEASIPKLKKAGRLNALRRISSLGLVTYKALAFVGDDMVKKEVMARFMTAEVEAATGKRDQFAINEQNYKFKYKGVSDKEGKPVHVFELKPKRKRVGLFKGELWLDPETFLPVREAGRLVKNPSMFIKKMEFVRDYQIREGVAYLVHMESKTQTRLVGRAELNIDYENFQPQQGPDQLVEEASWR